jgi:hypothetical protein
MVETIEMICGSFNESIRRAEVSAMDIGIAQENRGSNIQVEQGRESCIARQLQSVVEKCGTDRSALGPVDD